MVLGLPDGRTALHEFLKEHGKIVLKPFDGMGGRSIFVVSAGDLNVNVIIETLTHYGQRMIMAQRCGSSRISPSGSISATTKAMASFQAMET